MDGGHYGAGVARRTKRLWTDEEKRSICFQTVAPGVSVAQVARRYAVNANMVFKWLRDPRYELTPLGQSLGQIVDQLRLWSERHVEEILEARGQFDGDAPKVGRE